MFVVFSAGREHRRVLPISQLHPRNAASQTGALQTTKIYILGLTKQKRPTRKRMLCSQFSVLGENTDAYCPLASYIHGTRQARLVHFKQQKFTSLDLRSRNAQREKECYVRSFQCWARTQTRTAHQLATSTERGKLDWCTSNNKNLPPWTYEAETPNAKKNVMFVVFSAGREHRRVLPISQLHPRNAASQTGALQTTKIYLLGLTKQKRPTLCIYKQCFHGGGGLDWSDPCHGTTSIEQYSSHGTTSISNTHVMRTTSESAIIMSWNYLYQQYSCHGTTSIGRTHVMELPPSAGLMSWNYLYWSDSCHGTSSLYWQNSCHETTSISNTQVIYQQYTCHGTTLSAELMSWNYLYQQYSCHGTTSISNTHVMELPLSAILMSWN